MRAIVAIAFLGTVCAWAEVDRYEHFPSISTVAVTHNTTSHVMNHTKKAEPPSESIRDGHGVLALKLTSTTRMQESTEKVTRSAKETTYTTVSHLKTTKHHLANVTVHSLATVKTSTNLPTTITAKITTIVNPAKTYNPPTNIQTVDMVNSPISIKSVNKAGQPPVSLTTVNTPAEISTTIGTSNVSLLKNIFKSNAVNQTANSTKHSPTVTVQANCTPTEQLPTFGKLAYATLVEILRAAIAGQTSYDTVAAMLADTADKKNSKVPINRVKLVKSPSMVLSPFKFSIAHVKKVDALEKHPLDVDGPAESKSNVRPVFTKSSFTETPSEVIEKFQTPKRFRGLIDSRPTLVNFESKQGEANPFSYDVSKSSAGGKVPEANPFFFNSLEPLDSLERVKLSGSPVNELDAEMSPVLVMGNTANEGDPFCHQTDQVIDTVTRKPISSRPKKSNYVLDTLVRSGYEQNLFTPQSVNVIEPWNKKLFHWWETVRRSVKKSENALNPITSYQNAVGPESDRLRPFPKETYRKRSHSFFRLWPLSSYRNMPESPLDQMPQLYPDRSHMALG